MLIIYPKISTTRILKGNRSSLNVCGNIPQGLPVLNSTDNNHLLTFTIRSITNKHNFSGNAHIWISVHPHEDIKNFPGMQEQPTPKLCSKCVLWKIFRLFSIGQIACITFVLLKLVEQLSPFRQSTDRFYYSDRAQTVCICTMSIAWSSHCLLFTFFTIIPIQRVIVIQAN